MADWTTCPPQAGPARDAWILDNVNAEGIEVHFAELVVEANGHTGRFWVTTDGLRLGGVRLNVSAKLQQELADLASCMLLTPRLADLVWAARNVSLPPMPRPITSSTAAMLEQSAKIDAAAGDVPAGEILNTVGKNWVLVKAIFTPQAQAKRKAANYGWHFEGSNFQGIKGEPSVSLPGVRVIQGVGTVHDASHVDYSQICQLVLRSCFIDDEERDLADVIQDPELAALVSHEGPLPGWRQPDVGELPPSVELPANVPPETPPETPGGGSASSSSLLPKLLAGAAVFLAVGAVVLRR